MISFSKSLGFLEYQLQNPFFVSCIDGFRIDFGGEFQPAAETAGDSFHPVEIDILAETFSMGHQVKHGRFSFVCGVICLPARDLKRVSFFSRPTYRQDNFWIGREIHIRQMGKGYAIGRSCLSHGVSAR
jgi:hypothetical protein